MEYNQAKKMLGNKYYKENGDDIEVIRVVSVKNTSECKIQSDKGNEIKIVNPQFVYDNYTKLIPDGFVTISLVKLNYEKDKSYNDVIVTMHRMSDLDIGDNDPFVVCRQNITDFFYNLCSTSEDHPYVGVSVSRRTCPENIDFQIMRACDEIVVAEGVNIYLEDTVEDILSLVNTKKFDKCLELGLLTHLKSICRPDIGLVSVNGHCRNLKQLLLENNFSYDLDNAFNITPIQAELGSHILEIKDDEDKLIGYKLDSEISNQFSNLFKINITDSIVIDYDHDIDVNEIFGKFFLVRDTVNKLYIVKYFTVGEWNEKDLENVALKEFQSQFTSILYDKKYKK